MRLTLLLLLTLAPLAHAEDRWSDPAPGVRHLDRRLPDPNRVNALIIDLCQPGISLHATPPDEVGQRTSSFADAHGLLAAVNGGFYDTSNFNTIGLTVGGGQHWEGSWDNTTTGFIAFGSDNRAHISPTWDEAGFGERWMREVIPGMPLLVHNGAAVIEPCASHYCERHPRTAVGLDASRRTLILLTVDGRWSGISRGMNRDELAEQMLSLGADVALNLDGGGSTTMVLGGQVMNHPSDGSERRVSNHLGVALDPEARLSACCEVTPAENPSARFSDIPADHWALDAANALYDAQITQGCQAEPLAFCPDCGVSRAHAALFLQRAFDLPAGPSGRFEDVGPETVGAEAIEALAAAGLSDGCSAEPPLFCPHKLLTRAEAVTLIIRGAGFEPVAPTGVFQDVGQAEWYAPYAETALEACLVSGCEPGLFCPMAQITRAEFAIVLARARSLGGLGHCYAGEIADAGIAPPVEDAGVAPIQDILWPDAAPRDAGVEDARPPSDSQGGPLAPDGWRADAAPRPDMATPTQDQGPREDTWITREDARPSADARVNDAVVVTYIDADSEADLEQGGCHCRQGGGGAPWGLALLLMLPWGWRRRRGR